MIVPAKPLDADGFAPFGQVLDTPGGEPRLDFAARLANDRAAARPNLALVRAAPATSPLTVTEIERHLHSSQAFIPLDVARFLVLVCPSGADGGPDLGRLHAFIANGGQAINYDIGTWHHAMTALDRPATFAMLVWEDGSDGDCEFVAVERPLAVTFD